MTTAVRHYSLETILELTYLTNINENDHISTLIASFIKNPESVLQELDVQRLSAILSRQPSIISTTPKSATVTQYASIANIPIGDSTIINKSQLPESKLSYYPKANFNSNESLSAAMNITEKFERALSNIAPFLRDIFTELLHILTKILVDSHRQELLSSGLHALKQTISIVELLIEERLLSDASKNCIVKVANEADFILNRMCADDIRKASEFEQLSVQTTVEPMMINDKIAYSNSSRSFWKLDPWEDVLRRRIRLIRNPNGSIHNEATQKSSFNGINNDLITSVIHRL
ncbi:unnamed protein product, partial [Rotaria sp. Silwood2]